MLAVPFVFKKVEVVRKYGKSKQISQFSVSDSLAKMKSCMCRCVNIQ